MGWGKAHGCTTGGLVPDSAPKSAICNNPKGHVFRATNSHFGDRYDLNKMSAALEPEPRVVVKPQKKPFPSGLPA